MTPTPKESSAARDWSEDFPDENGNYSHVCSICKLPFTGHKHRINVCKVCAGPESAPMKDRRTRLHDRRRISVHDVDEFYREESAPQVETPAKEMCAYCGHLFDYPVSYHHSEEECRAASLPPATADQSETPRTEDAWRTLSGHAIEPDWPVLEGRQEIVHADFARQLERELAAATAKLEACQAELRDWRTWGVIEVAVRNPNVAEYMRHWEQRTESAERRVEELTKHAEAMHIALAYRCGGTEEQLAYEQWKAAQEQP